MIKKLLIAFAALVVLGGLCVGLVGWWAYRQITAPIYVPGDLASTAGLVPPPASEDGGAWRVEDDIALHHFARGDGPPLLFVHGGPGVPVREPMPWLDGIASAHRLHFYDQRGCGESTRPFDRFAAPNWYANMRELEATLGLGAQIADIERIRRVLDVERLVLVGHSFGGFLATMYAAEFPDRVEALILLAPADVLVMPSPGEDLFAIVRSRLPATDTAAYDAFLESYLDFGALFENDEETLARQNWRLGNYILIAMGRAPRPDGETAALGGWMVHAMYLSMGRRHDYTSALARVRAPALVVHAENDLQAVRVSRQYVDGIAGAELCLVEGADHFFDAEFAGLRERVLAFLATSSGDQAGEESP